jgi:predicted  nucleic acid-binding Zn-ribbon protein
MADPAKSFVSFAHLEKILDALTKRFDSRVVQLREKEVAPLLKRIADLETKATSLETRASRHAEHLRKLEDWRQGQR